ncbi:MAG: TIGR03088 family PEP-CTERM/XrtA system glycosyltransferase [Pseudomonadota bacterium]|nr:TIGR03088 family PEP-CTERM/XrtA system glycosyltransferase [Pseudomonadota bacterium]MDP1903289.1 TIGR03088 family PEP-CTERM/XrtA system glycosyltransferase [Pseudomonadota bacterium]MDP2353387.1 TIGR03088 family PEP-CTERM/XrtA system glycosyltransferase [Pseudomonadota bacterium]
MSRSRGQPPLIAHVVHHFGTGGMENGMVNLFNHMPEQAYRHVVICLAGHGEFRRRIKRRDIEFFDLGRRPGHDLRWHVRLFHLLRRLRPDILHTRNLSTLEAQFVAALAGVPGRIHGEHGRDVFDLEGRNWKYNLLRRAARHFIHRYIAVSRDLAGWLGATVGVAPGRISQIYNGVDRERFHPRQGARPDCGRPEFFSGAEYVIGSLGRMAEVKDYPGLVEAFIRLCRVSPRAASLRLILVGDGPARARCQERLDAAGLGNQAWLPGDRADTAEWLRAFDVFVLNSLGEGISNTILEAMATALPVIATRVGGNPELVRPEETGLLIAPGEPATLAVALGQYVDDAARGLKEGQAARARIEMEFDWARATSAYLAAYAALPSHP